MWKITVCLFVILIGVKATGQDLSDPPFKTPNTHLNPDPSPKKHKSGKGRIHYIIKKDTKGFLAGNKCFEEVTKKMGFVYLAVPKGQSLYTSEFNRNLHNMGAKTMVLLKNGPFWKIRVNKAYRKCKYGYGDYAAP